MLRLRKLNSPDLINIGELNILLVNFKHLGVLKNYSPNGKENLVRKP